MNAAVARSAFASQNRKKESSAIEKNAPFWCSRCPCRTRPEDWGAGQGPSQRPPPPLKLGQKLNLVM